MPDKNIKIYVFNEETGIVDEYNLLYQSYSDYLLLSPGGGHVSVSSNTHTIGRSELEVLRLRSKKIYEEIEEINYEIKLIDDIGKEEK